MEKRTFKNPVIQEFRLQMDTGDTWGSVMAWRFSIADFLTDRDPDAIPEEWEFRQSFGGSDTEASEYETLVDLFDGDVCSIADVLQAGKVLHKYSVLLESEGHSY